MEQQRADGTGIWIAAFLAVALVMIVLGVGWLAFGPPFS
jgi:hypothetical protein